MMKKMIMILALVLAFAAPVHAEQEWWKKFYLEGSIGAVLPQYTVYDGTWRQDGVQKPNYRTADFAWSVGVGYRFNSYWSVQSHRLDLGVAKVKSRFVSDSDYDPVNHVCLNGCPASNTQRVEDRMVAYDLTVTRHFPLQGTDFEPYIKFGGAIMHHSLRWGYVDGPLNDFTFTGLVPMLAVGVGASYQHFFWDNTFYTGTTSMNSGCIGGGEFQCGYPLAKRALLSTFGIRITF